MKKLKIISHWDKYITYIKEDKNGKSNIHAICY